MIWYYEQMDWPSIPLELEQEIIEYIKDAKVVVYPNYENASKIDKDCHDRILKYIKETNVIPSYHHFEGTDNLKKWVRENLPIPNTYDIKIQQISNFTEFPKHTDHVREFSYNYLFYASNARTNWFDEDDNMVESVCYQQYKWYKNNASVTHSVTGIYEPRVAVTLFQRI